MFFKVGLSISPLPQLTAYVNGQNICHHGKTGRGEQIIVKSYTSSLILAAFKPTIQKFVSFGYIAVPTA